MNYDIIVEKWIEQLNKLFHSIDIVCKKEQETNPESSHDIYIRHYYNKLLIGNYLLCLNTEQQSDIEIKIDGIKNYYNNSIFDIIDKIKESAGYFKKALLKTFREYYLSSVVLGIYNDKGLICKEYDAITSFIKDESDKGLSMAYMGDMTILAPIFPISNYKNYILLDDQHEIELYKNITSYVHKYGTNLYSFTEIEKINPECLFINILYCDNWNKEKIKRYDISIRRLIHNGLKAVYILTNLNDILSNKILKCIGISLNRGFKTKIINVFNDKCIVCIDLRDYDNSLIYDIYEFDFATLFVDYSHTLDIRQKLHLTEHYIINKYEFLNKFCFNRISDTKERRNFKRYYLYNIIVQRSDIRKLPEISDSSKTNYASFYSIDQGKRITHKFDKDLLYSYHKTICTADDFNKITIAGSTYDNGSIRFIDKPVLIINKKHYLPTFFNPINGPILIDISENNLYSVKTEIVAPEYLVNELNKPSFIKKNINYNIDNQFSFLQSDIYLPNNENSLERQKQIYRYDKQIYINKLIKDFDIEISSTFNNSISDLPKGTILNDRKYIIDSKIGEGGFSKTYKAIRLLPADASGIAMSANVVIKEFFINRIHHRNNNRVEVSIDDNINMAKKALEKFWDEANKIKKLSDCSNIISIYDIFDENGTCYYSMEYIDGNDLAYFCEFKPNGYLEQEEALKIILDVCNAVKAMHSISMNHFDIKPENILIGKNGQVKLIDFGTACQFISDDEHSTVLPVVSKGYSPIELGRISSFTPQSDIYSVGATLYNILTGYEVPSSIELYKDFNLLIRTDNINDKLWHAIISAMNPDLNKRPSCIDEFVQLLL